MGILHNGQYQFSHLTCRPTARQSFRACRQQLEDAIRTVKSAGITRSGLHYKKVPSGFPSDHPRAELLKFNGLYASTQAIPSDLLGKPELVDLCFEHCRNLLPLHRWLVEYL
jgi:hypothetical protein